MIAWAIGTVLDKIEETEAIQVLVVDTIDGKKKAIHYLSFHSPLSVGDKVLLNRTATILQLGTGGYDFIVTPLNNIFANTNQNDGHIMKLRYTPYQFSVQSCEEQGSKYHDVFKEVHLLNGLPVVLGELHSMLPIVISLYRQLERKHHKKRSRIVYIMTDGASLPIAYSRHVYQLKKLGLLDYTITIGHAFGGDLEAINIFTGLIAAKYIYHADFVMVLMGPGIVGTGTLLGHTGVELGININAVNALKGYPITIARASEKDKRKRHRGISHHTISCLKHVAQTKSIIPYPNYFKEKYPEDFQQVENDIGTLHHLDSVIINQAEIKKFISNYPYKITTMGRTIDDDPLFFHFVASATYWLFEHLSE